MTIPTAAAKPQRDNLRATVSAAARDEAHSVGEISRFAAAYDGEFELFKSRKKSVKTRQDCRLRNGWYGALVERTRKVYN